MNTIVYISRHTGLPVPQGSPNAEAYIRLKVYDDTTREMQQANNRQRITIGNLRQQLRQQRNRVAILMEEREGGAQ